MSQLLYCAIRSGVIFKCTCRFRLLHVVICQNFCTDVQKTIFDQEKQSPKKAVGIMLNCLKNSKDSWFREFKEALKVTRKFASD